MNFFHYYAPAGDIFTLILCVLCWVFLFFTYSQKRQSLYVFLGTSVTCALVAVESLAYHFLLQNAPLTFHSSVAMYTLETSIYCSLLSIFIWFISYVVLIYKIPKAHYKIVYGISVPIFLGYTIMRLIKPFLAAGSFELNYAWTFTKEPQWGFLVCYTLLTFFIYCLMQKYRKNITPYSAKILSIAMLISLTLTILPSAVPAVTFLTLSFMIPVLVALLVFHYNPYDNSTGSLDTLSFPHYLTDRRKKNLGMYALTLKDFYLHDGNDIAMLFIQNAAEIFADYQTFRGDYNTIYLVYNKNENISPEVLINVVHKRVNYLYDNFRIPYKLVHIDIDQEMLRDPRDFILLTKYLFNTLPWNKKYQATYEDLARINRTHQITSLLKEIFQSAEKTHPAIQIYCQPIYDTRAKAYKSIEILTRLSMNGELVYPNEFLPIADYYGYIYDYNKKAFYKACEYLAKLRREGSSIKRMSVNFSIREFTNPTFVADILRTLDAYNIPGECLAIEITESVGANTTPEVLQSIIWKLKANGIKVYLDDFGVDYSNFDRILHLPVDVIKFDACITWALRDNTTLKPIISTMSESFKGAGYEVMFEGVETDDDEKVCQYLKANYLQGYKYAKPMEIESLQEFLQK